MVSTARKRDIQLQIDGRVTRLDVTRATIEVQKDSSPTYGTRIVAFIYVDELTPLDAALLVGDLPTAEPQAALKQAGVV